MINHRCEQEDKLLQMLGGKGVSEEMLKHIAECSACAEIVKLEGIFQGIRSEVSVQLPSSSSIWLQAQLFGLEEKRKRFFWLRMALSGVAVIVSFIVSMGILATGWLNDVGPVTRTPILDLNSGSFLSPFVVFTSLILLVVVILSLVDRRGASSTPGL